MERRSRLKKPFASTLVVPSGHMGALPDKDGLLFGPTGSGKMYLAMYDHRGRNWRKSCWAIDVPPPHEYAIFDGADARVQVDIAGPYWGVRDASGSTLGTRGERLAKFPRNAVEAPLAWLSRVSGEWAG